MWSLLTSQLVITMKHFTLQEMKSWSRFYRGNVVNSLSGFKSVSLIGTANAHGQSNLAIFSNIVHLGADPALVAFVNRPRDASTHTIANIEATGVYTINHIHEEIVAQAHQTSAKYAIDESEFDKTGLQSEWIESCKAPFVRQSRVRYAMKLEEIIPIKQNGTYFVIGAITDIHLPSDALLADGFLDLEKTGSLASLGIDGYCKASMLARYKYAKPGVPPQKI